MIREDRFYCLSCSLEKPVQSSGRLFRTGFYRSEMRLGLCAGCTDDGEAAGRSGLAQDGRRGPNGSGPSAQ